jgi:cell division protein FtsN
MAGLAAGLVFSAALALYITQSPLPFVDRMGTKPAAKSANGRPADRATADEPIDPNKGMLSKDAGQTETPAEAGIDTRQVSPSGMTYLLQVGAFRTQEDADQMRARMAILGFESKVSEVEREGAMLYRVRIGPYAAIEELNKVKSRVSENGIDSIVIRVNLQQ